MKCYLSFVVLTLFAAATAFAQSPAGAPSTPPLTVKPATVHVTPALKTAAEAAHKLWQENGGAEFQSSLTFFKGTPLLMVVTSKGEPAGKGIRRKRAIASACDFLLSDNAFPSASICVVEIDPADSKKQNSATVEIRRNDYKAATKKLGKVSLSKGVAGAKKGDEDLVNKLSLELGIK